MTDWQDLEPGQAMMVDWTAAEYHADRTCQTNTGLGTLLSDPDEYRRHADGKPVFDEGTDAKLRGTRVHLAILEPEEWRDRMVMPRPAKPKGVRRGTEAYLKWTTVCQTYDMALAALQASGQDPIVIDAAKRQRVEDMAEQVRSHPFAAEVLALDGKAEQTVIWREPTTGILTKVRVDWLAWVDEDAAARHDRLEPGWAVADVKTTRDTCPGPFWRSVRKFGYGRQGALYSDAVRALKGGPVTHYILAVESEWNYKSAVWRLTDDDLESGREEYMGALKVLMRRRFTGDWREPWQKGCEMLIPPWRGK